MSMLASLSTVSVEVDRRFQKLVCVTANSNDVLTGELLANHSNAVFDVRAVCNVGELGLESCNDQCHENHFDELQVVSHVIEILDRFEFSHCFLILAAPMLSIIFKTFCTPGFVTRLLQLITESRNLRKLL